MQIWEWKEQDLNALLATCETDGLLPVIEKYFVQDGLVLESGCGAGRYVRFLQDRGWETVGVEWSQATMEMVHHHWPDLRLITGDSANSPFADGIFTSIISLGVVEHWKDGPQAPLQDIYRVLKPGGIALITVPCLSSVRQIKRFLWFDEITQLPKAVLSNLINGKRFCINRLNKNYKYAVFPAYGDSFFEYRMTQKQFLKELNLAGFNVIEHFPQAIIDGFYHELNLFGLLMRYQNFKFYPTNFAETINKILTETPFAHPHMQAAIVTKP